MRKNVEKDVYIRRSRTLRVRFWTRCSTKDFKLIAT